MSGEVEAAEAVYAAAKAAMDGAYGLPFRERCAVEKTFFAAQDALRALTGQSSSKIYRAISGNGIGGGNGYGDGERPDDYRESDVCGDEP